MIARRGTVYVIVMTSVVFVSAIGLAAVSSARSASRAAEASRDEAAARRLAASAVELALRHARNTTDWRTAVQGIPLFEDLSVGGGMITGLASDPADNDLGDNLAAPVTITGIGYAGVARQMYSVTIHPESVALASAASAIHAGGGIEFQNAYVRADRVVSSNASVTASGSTVNAAVSATGTVTGSTYAGGTSPGSSARQMPDASLFDAYALMGTAIDFASIPSRRISGVVLAPGRNPYPGGTNLRGIYVIDCSNENIEIRDARIHGTLVLRNVGRLTMDGSVLLESAEAGLPALLVEGDVTVATDSDDLTEQNVATNLNSTGAPYGGSTDGDTSDVYPSLIRGLVYVSGSADVKAALTLRGVLIVGGSMSFSSSSTTNAVYRLEEVPAYFAAGEFRVDRSTWARVFD
jgi:hypothetical protein